jgi:hypothetical protein
MYKARRKIKVVTHGKARLNSKKMFMILEVEAL